MIAPAPAKTSAKVPNASAMSERAETGHDVPARLHRAQRVRGAPGAQDHAADAAQPHGRVHPRGAGRQQQRARPRHLRRARPQHLRHLAALPGRHRLRLLEPGDRPRRLHPGADRRQAVREAHAATRCSVRSAWTTALSTGRRSARPHDRARGARGPVPRPAALRADDGGRRSLLECRGPGSLPRFQLDDGSIDGRVVLAPRWMQVQRTVPAPQRRCARRLRARRGPAPLESLGSAP